MLVGSPLTIPPPFLVLFLRLLQFSCGPPPSASPSCSAPDVSVRGRGPRPPGCSSLGGRILSLCPAPDVPVRCTGPTPPDATVKGCAPLRLACSSPGRSFFYILSSLFLAFFTR